jgi:hypothetical protein
MQHLFRWCQSHQRQSCLEGRLLPLKSVRRLLHRQALQQHHTAGLWLAWCTRLRISSCIPRPAQDPHPTHSRFHSLLRCPHQMCTRRTPENTLALQLLLHLLPHLKHT